MKIAILSPSPVPYMTGGHERLLFGIYTELMQRSAHAVELIKIPVDEHSFWGLIDGYAAFLALDLAHFDLVLSTKYPSWCVDHSNHVVYMEHCLRGLYDTYPIHNVPEELDNPSLAARSILDAVADPLVSRHDLLDLLITQRSNDTLRPEEMALPGPLVRAIVHRLDADSLDCRAVRRHYAISATVRRRTGYFPPDAPVTVIHQPATLSTKPGERATHILTVGRLDDGKRIHDVVAGHLASGINLPLIVVGDGPKRAVVEALARRSPLIRLVERVDDDSLQRLYRDAAAVAYVPYDEDFGLVTIEALATGKPVITCTDSGGPLEFIQDNVNGLVVAPGPDAIGDAIRRLALDDPLRVRLAAGAKRTRIPRSWSHLVNRLVEPSVVCPAAVPISDVALRLLVVTHLSIEPARGGGQIRVRSLYGNLGEKIAVTVLSLVHESRPYQDEILDGTIRAVAVPRSAGHVAAEHKLIPRCGGVLLEDVALPRLWVHDDAFLAQLAQQCKWADAIVVCHPYCLPAVRSVWDGPLIYEAQDVELDMKREGLSGTETAHEILGEIEAVEGACCREADLILVCSERDGERLAELYGADPGRVLLVPNGADFPPELRFHDDLNGPGYGYRAIGIFVGSWHPPNQVAIEQIAGWAAAHPQVAFLVVGSCGIPVAGQERPSNLTYTCEVEDEELHRLLAAADFALNPVTSGGGSNLKICDYTAHGLPILTTTFGLRGTKLQPGTDCISLDDGFGPAFEKFLAMPPSLRCLMVRHAWSRLYPRHDWRHIASELAAVLCTRDYPRHPTLNEEDA